MTTIAQRIEELRTARGLSRPALSAELGLPRLTVEKFETGRQTPNTDQQNKLARYFGVSLFYLRGETDDPTSMGSWLSDTTQVGEAPAPKPQPKPAAVKQAAKPQEDGAFFMALVNSESFRKALHQTVLDVLRSPEGQEIIHKSIQK